MVKQTKSEESQHHTQLFRLSYHIADKIFTTRSCQAF